VTERPPDDGAAPDEPAGTHGADEGRDEGRAQGDGGSGRDGGGPSPTRRRRRPRRAVRGGTNPSAEVVPDVVAPREEPSPGETQHDRWLREQRPPHWE